MKETQDLAHQMSRPSGCGPIGVFDSGYGGLTILSALREQLPHYDYIYLGDNARSPYGTRSFDVIKDFTLQAVRYLFDRGCPLVILACNTASAKALREIQQRYLPTSGDPTRRVLGVIRPTVEVLDEMTQTGHVGVLATPGTVSAHSYQAEVEKLSPHLKICEHACPMWVPLVEYGESASAGADYFVRQEVEAVLGQDQEIDTLVLACTHYPLLRPKIEACLPPHVRLVAQGELVATSLEDYLERHPEMDARLTLGGSVTYLTTECADKFEGLASIFISSEVRAQRVKIDEVQTNSRAE